MKRNFALFILFFIATITFARVTQKGKVLIYTDKAVNEAGKSIKLRIEGFESIQTDSLGRFELTFENKKYGQVLGDIKIESPGYILANRDILFHWKISQYEDLELVLCEKRLYNLIRPKIYKSVQTLFKKKFVDANGNLGTIFDQNMENIDTYLEDFLFNQMVSKDELNKQAYRLLREEKIDEALKLYEEIDVLEEYKKNNKPNSIYESRMFSYLNLLAMSADMNNYTKAIDLFRQFYLANKKNDFVAMKYASLLYSLENYNGSEQIYRELMKSTHQRTAAMATAKVSHILIAKNKYVDVQKMAEQCLSTLNESMKLAHEKSLFLRERATLHNSLMISYLYLHNQEKALSNMEKTISLGKELYEIDPLYYAKQYANILNSASMVCKNCDLTERGKELATECIEISKNIYTHTKNRDAKILANAYLSMANLLNDKSSLEESDNYYTKAEQVFEECLLSNPTPTYKVYLANCNQNHSILYFSDIDRYKDKILKMLNKSMILLEDAHKTMPEYVSRSLFITYHYLECVNEKVDIAKAKEYAQKNLVMIEDLYKKLPEGYASLYGVAHHDLARCLSLEGRYEEAMYHFNIAIKISPKDEELKNDMEQVKANMSKK